MNNILLIYGGNSVEHEISIITALQIKNKYKAALPYPRPRKQSTGECRGL